MRSLAGFVVCGRYGSGRDGVPAGWFGTRWSLVTGEEAWVIAMMTDGSGRPMPVNRCDVLIAGVSSGTPDDTRVLMSLIGTVCAGVATGVTTRYRESAARTN